MRIFYKKYDSDEALLESLGDSIYAPYTTECYSYYPDFYNKGTEKYFYFGFYADPTIDKLIEEINETFNNIKIVKILSKQVTYIGYWVLEEVPKPKIFMYYVFRVELNSEYSENSHFVLTLAVVQFLRSLCPEYTHYQLIKNYDDSDLITRSVAMFNETTGMYGSWCSLKFSKKEFLKLDNISLMNLINKRVDMDEMPYNTALIRKIKNRNE